MKKILWIIIVLCFFGVFSAQKNVKFSEDEAHFVFPKCKNLSKDRLNACGLAELGQFILRNMEYPQQAIDSGYQGKIVVKFIVDKEGNIGNISVDNSKTLELNNQKTIYKLLADEALRVMQNLQDSIGSGELSVIPARANGQAVRSFYRVPITFKFPDNQTDSDFNHLHKMVIATYRDREDTIQFCKNIEGTLYAYSLSNGGEKLLAAIKEQPMTNNAQYYLYLLDLALSRREFLLNFGKIYGQEVEMYIDRGTKYNDDGENLLIGEGMKIKVYKAGDSNHPIETFDNFSDLNNSPYVSLLLK
ncbi:MAG: energy transducer TonB [Flavobacteriaceae bacterium]|jgi:protein TonB|nr:energy transducer TonB [Flavobacteriaceae bacterium]